MDHFPQAVLPWKLRALVNATLSALGSFAFLSFSVSCLENPCSTLPHSFLLLWLFSNCQELSKELENVTQACHPPIHSAGKIWLFFFLCSSHSIRWRESTDKWRRQYYFPYRTASYSSFPLVCEGSEDILHPASTWETIPSTWWLQGGCCPVAQGGNTAWGRRDQVSLKPTGMSPLEGMKRILTIFKRRKKDPKPQLPRLQLFGKENLDPGNSWSRPKLCGGIQGRDF